MTRGWRRVDSVTEFDGWTVHWFLTESDTVVVIGVTDPSGNKVPLPRPEIALHDPSSTLPDAVVAHLETNKFRDCPRMQEFLQRFRQSRGLRP